MSVPLTALPLRKLLRLDAAVTLLSGIILLPVAGPLAELTGIDRSVLTIAALLLIPIAVFIFVIARSPVIPRRGVMTIVTINLIWVVVSLLLPFAGVISPNGLGWVLLIAQAVIVAGAAGLQYAGANRAPIPA